MLLSFRFSNHKSFRDEQQLNLTPVYDDNGDSHDESALEAVAVAGIFGANASGKSNVIGALSYFSNLVRWSDRDSEPDGGITRHPFRLDPGIAREPSSYAADILIDGVRHSYGCTLDNDQIIEEWLYSYPLRKKRKIFVREGQEFDWGEESKRSSIRKVSEIVAPTALFISVAARFEVNRPAQNSLDESSGFLHDTYSHLGPGISGIGPADNAVGARAAMRYARIIEDPFRWNPVMEMLRAADIGLQDVFAARLKADPGEPPRFSQLQFSHRGAAGDVTLGIRDESSGTLRLLDLAARAIPILESGRILLVDEIDSSLHPLLTANLVRLFRSMAANRSGAQLIFTSHDATLLGSIDGEDVLRRDQVWFTEKGDDGASDLFALSEFKPRRQGENRQKRYLNGIYGAIPELSMRMFEQAIASRADASAEEA